jgi:Aspartyl protease
MVAIVLTFSLMVVTSLAGFAAGGYQFLFGKSHTAIRFELYRDLIVLPARINDTLNVRLILDTGTRSMLLYGKRFAGLGNIAGNKGVKVSGWGSPLGVNASVSFPNNIRIGNVKGDGLAIAVVPTRPLFDDKPAIDGIIGYELFVKFVVEINYKTKTLHLFDKLPYNHDEGFTSVPLEINKAMPQVKTSIVLSDNSSVDIQLLVDTGSSLGLTVFSKDKYAFYSSDVQHPVGIGLNGVVNGFDLYFKHMFLGEMKVRRIPSHVVNVTQHPDEKFSYCGSVGAAFLKKHIVIFDYPSSRMFLLSYKDAKRNYRNSNARHKSYKPIKDVIRIVDLPS